MLFRVIVSRYESVIATLCENLDSLDEPEARAAMIWIVGEYAERIDNADELLESFLEGFHDESTQVCLGESGEVVNSKMGRPFFNVGSGTNDQQPVLAVSSTRWFLLLEMIKSPRVSCCRAVKHAWYSPAVKIDLKRDRRNHF